MLTKKTNIVPFYYRVKIKYVNLSLGTNNYFYFFVSS
jgi:hypothetical protein